MKIRPVHALWLVLALPVSRSPLFAGTDPYLSPAQVEHLKNLPNSVNDNTSLIVRAKHLRSVQFLGDGVNSRFGYVKNNGLIRQGLWLSLRNQGRESWASASVIFNPPLNVERYDSLAVWVRALSPGFRFWVEAQDSNWSEFSSLQARTNILPAGDLPPDKPFLIVIPYSHIFQETPLGFDRLSRLRFEFGSGTAGNKRGDTLEILGIAFIQQSQPLDEVTVRPALPALGGVASLNRRLKSPSIPIPQSKTEEEGPKSFSAAFHGPSISGVEVKMSPSQSARTMAVLDHALAYPIIKKVEKNGEPWLLIWVDQGKRGWVSENAVMMGEPKVQFFLSRKVVKAPFDSPAPEWASPEKEPEAVAEAPRRTKEHWLNLGRLFKRAAPAVEETAEKEEEPVVEKAEAAPPFWTPALLRSAGVIAGGAALVGLLFVLFLRLLKRRPWAAKSQGEKIWHSIQWPFKTPEAQWESRSEEIFWKNQAERGVRFATLSSDGLSLTRLSSDAIIGESFLLRQAANAKKEKIELAPSVCFVRTLFHMDSFFATPSLYFWQSVPASESHLSDEELRRKYLGYFPLWVPPFWQKKHRLPQRMLVAYGKLMGSVFTSDSVQFNLLSPELRKMAVRLLKKFAKISPAVRVESAASLLNSTLKYYLAQNQSGDLPKVEFWREVISEVKKDFPSFRFIADGQGLNAEQLLQVGFDFVENEKVRQSLAESMEIENAGAFLAEMAYQRPDILNRSVYRIEGSWEHSPSPLARRTRLAAAIAAFLPGRLNVEGPGWPDLKGFVSTMDTWAGMKTGFFKFLTTSSPQVVCLARWSGKNMILALFNVHRQAVECRVQLDSLKRFLPNRNLTLFHDLLHGEMGLWDLRENGDPRPAVAVSTAELHDKGFAIRLPGLSLKVFSVNLSNSIFSDSRRGVLPASAPPSLPSS